MAEFSKQSLYRLKTCHKDLQKLFEKVIKHRDCVVLCGFRPELEQNEAFRTGVSKVKWPDSKHNSNPSRAIDVAPYPINWSDRDAFINFAGFVAGVASQMGIKIRCGIDFNQDLNFKNDSLFDGPHFELAE